MGRKNKNKVTQKNISSQEISGNDVVDVVAISAFIDQGKSLPEQR